jgi:hypothetical protein
MAQDEGTSVEFPNKEMPTYSNVRVNGKRVPTTLTKEDIEQLARMSRFNPLEQGQIGYDPYERYKQLENPQFYANQDIEAFVANQSSKTESFYSTLIILFFCLIILAPFLIYLCNRTDRTEDETKSLNDGGTYPNGELYR